MRMELDTDANTERIVLTLRTQLDTGGKPSSKTVDRLHQLVRTNCAQWETFVRKNTDYGDAFAEHGPVGVLVRIGDKLKRLTQVSRTGVTLVNDEGLRDTLLDLANYAAMAVVSLDEEAP